MNENNPVATDTHKEPCFGAALPLMAGLLMGMGEKKPSRRHSFQQMVFSLLQNCYDREDAEAVVADMQDAVESTKAVLGSMVW